MPLHPLIVPPTWRKHQSYENKCLSAVIEATIQQVSQAESVYFLGYSFADSDIVIREVFQKAKEMRGGMEWDSVQVVDIALDAVLPRYQRQFSNAAGYDGKVSEFLDTIPDSTDPFRDPMREVTHG
jgi:hypothetical protein